TVCGATRLAIAAHVPYTTLCRSEGSLPQGGGIVVHAAALREIHTGPRGVQRSAVRGSPGSSGSSKTGRLENRAECLSPRAVEPRSEEHTSELQSRENLVCRLLLE